MAGQNDVFSVLGRIEVDMAALKASLGTAEKEIAASTNRQKKSYADFANAVIEQQERLRKAQAGAEKGDASGLYGLKFGEITKGAGKAAESIGRVSHTSNAAIGSVRNFAQAVNLVAPGLGSMAGGLGGVLRAFGPWAVALAAGGILLRTYAGHLQEVAQAKLDTKLAIEAREIGSVSTALQAANRDFETQNDLVKRSKAEWSSFGNIVDSNISTAKLAFREMYDIVTGSNAKGNLAEATKNFNEAFTTVEIPKSDLDKRKALNALDEQQIRTWLTQADTTEKLKNGYTALEDSLRERKRLLIESINAEDAAMRAIVEKTGDKIALAALDVVRMDKLTKMEQQMADVVGQARDAQDKSLAKLADATAQSTNKILAETERRRVSGSAVAGIEEANAFAVMEAEERRQGVVVDGSGRIEAAYQRQRTEIEAVDAAAETAYTREAKRLEALIKANQNATANKDKLAELGSDRETARLEAQNKLRTLRSNVERDQALESKRVWSDTISDTKSKWQSYFDIRKSMGQSTLASEINFQNQLNGLYKQGTAQWYDGMAKVASLQKQMRDEAKSTFQSVAGDAAESLKQKHPGRKEFTAKELETEAGVMQKEDERRASAFGSGRAVDVDALTRGMNRQQAFKQLEQQGGLRNAFDTAISPPTAPTVGSQAMNGFAMIGETLTASADAHSAAAGKLTAAADALKSAAQAVTASAGASQTSQQAVLSSNIARTGELEAKRGPAAQGGE